jgi:Methyltransferase domain
MNPVRHCSRIRSRVQPNEVSYAKANERHLQIPKAGTHELKGVVVTVHIEGNELVVRVAGKEPVPSGVVGVCERDPLGEPVVVDDTCSEHFLRGLPGARRHRLRRANTDQDPKWRAAAISAGLARGGLYPVAVDFSTEQLQTAERYQPKHGVSFELVLATAESLAYDDTSFDLAVSDYGTSLWCDHRRWLPEAHPPSGRRPARLHHEQPTAHGVHTARRRSREGSTRSGARRAEPRRVPRRRSGVPSHAWSGCARSGQRASSWRT